MFRRLESFPRTAVIVDDDEVIARIEARALQSIGYEVIGIARDERDAERFLGARVGLFVIDVVLDGTTGFEVAKHILARCDAPLLFVTGTEEAPTDELVGLDGVFGFLGKPFTTAALRATVELLEIQRATRARLCQLERHYHALFEQAAVGVAEIDAASGRIVDVNRTCAAIFASTVEAMTGADFYAHVGEADREVLRARLRALGTTGEPYRAEVPCVRADRAGVWVRLTSAPLDGTPGHQVLMVEDISERERVQSANRAKTDFLAHMSHELRTPLNAVLGLSEALLEGTFGALADVQADALATIHGSGKHLLDLINDVLDIARVESGRLPIDAQQVLLRPLLDESTALIFGQLTAKAQRLVVDVPGALPPVEVDRRRIKQVLLNLLGNAIKFSTIGATIALRVTVAPDEREVAISVVDHGPGIATADRERIFEPFVTVDTSPARSQDGAGLGLALAKRIAELHRGRLEVESELGRGSTFTLVLPCSTDHVADPTPPVWARRPALAARAPRGTLLLAEDNDATVFAVRAYLEKCGYQVRTVRDGLAAYEAAASPDIAAILMDIRLDGMDGLEATRKIRTRPECATTPIIALTAHAMPEDEVRCLAAGASAYLAKPVRLGQLAELLDHLLEEV